MTTSGAKPRTFVAGVLIKQVEDDNQRLELGVVTDAVFVRQTINIMLRAQGNGVSSVSSLKAQTAKPAPMRTPGSATTDTHDITDAVKSANGQAAKPSGGLVESH